MCNLCNGTHVVHVDTQSSISFHNCPNCGPESKENQKARYELLYAKLAEAEMRLALGSVS
ncbi:hypothetical protein GJU41_12575 [Bacillus idriensis]|uniref:Uncharacterized protein n=1 Tax=Metabacillus idriensis TaxID=324768 RepID=A0A6I2MAK8_9BACI|nr:hypothetical protein [Metabacillus idriensis]MRX54809.1 hypothetical protein [Metabacillus idriensis]